MRAPALHAAAAAASGGRSAHIGAAMAAFLWIMLVKAGLATGAALAMLVTLLGDMRF